MARDLPSKILSRRDLAFLLYEWLDAESLTKRERFADHSRETFDAALATCEAIATDLFAPHNRKSDANEPTFDGERVTMIPDIAVALKAFNDAGLMAAGRDFDLGGMQLPALVEKAGFAWFKAANVGTSSYPFLTIGNANLLLAHGSDDQVERYVKPMMTGRFFGTMCLSETQAGSSLSDVRTKAVPQTDGRYRLFGHKMWVSAGEHDLSDNIVHLVLAKIPEADGSLPPGVKGISLFIVPKFVVNADAAGNEKTGERNDVVLAGLNHKMGYRGTTNCLLNFGEGRYRPEGAAGAIGELVGEPGRGLAQMFHMMNEARIGVGLGAVALGYTGYLHALDYARNRPQGRPMATKTGKDAGQPQVPIVEHADVKRMLLAMKSYVEGGLALNLYCAKLVDDERTGEDEAVRAEAKLLLDILTPIAKSWPSQWCLEANSLAIQVHGGYGYTRDYAVEQFYRDNRLNPIHEGTHGIQAIDLLGRKVVMQGGAALTALTRRIERSIEEAEGHVGDASCSGTGFDFAPAIDTLVSFWKRLRDTTATLHAAGDANRALANASVYLEAFGHLVIAWVWLEQAMAAARALDLSGVMKEHPAVDEGDADFYRGKLAACRWFFAFEVPKVAPMLDLLASLDRTTETMQDAWF